MAAEANPDAERARSAAREEIPALLYHPSEDVLAALLENPRFDAAHLSLLLERKELSGEFLEEIARRKKWLAEYAVKRRLAFHVHTPRLTVMRLARQLYLMDLVQLSLLPSAAVELRRLAEELILVRLPQVPAWGRDCCTTYWALPRPIPRASAAGRSRPSSRTAPARVCASVGKSSVPRRAGRVAAAGSTRPQ
mgnify:CR=1 FL=1